MYRNHIKTSAVPPCIILYFSDSFTIVLDFYFHIRYNRKSYLICKNTFTFRRLKMGRKGLDKATVEAAIEELKRNGQQVTNRGIREITKTGSLDTIARLRKEVLGVQEGTLSSGTEISFALQKEISCHTQNLQNRITKLEEEIYFLKDFFVSEIEKIKEQEKQEIDTAKEEIYKSLLMTVARDVYHNINLPEEERETNASIARKHDINPSLISAVKKLLS